MFKNIDLKKLAQLTAPERTFLSIYLSGSPALQGLEGRLQKVRMMLRGGGAERDEREHFDENVNAVEEYLQHSPLTSGSLCLFSCRPLDFFLAITLALPVKDMVRIDSSPYLRPLAELQEEYEDVAVVVADNKKARVFLVSAAVAGPGEIIRGNVKNHVRVGGWSQQRYERRRDKQLLHYARQIVTDLSQLAKEEHFRHILLVGGREILQSVHENMSQELKDKLIEKTLDLSKGEDTVNREIMTLLQEQERLDDRDHWEFIRAEYLRGGLAVVGLVDVLWAAKMNRVEMMVVNRNFDPMGSRCRNCGNLEAVSVEKCPSCGSEHIYEVAVVNEILDLLLLSGAETYFTDSVDTLSEAGEIAAQLRY